MRDLGLGALAHANRHAAYLAMDNPRWPELSVLQAAHAAELLIKARIAQEHPLLIFEHLPSTSQSSFTRLELEDLFKQGRTFQWSTLPERLWAATGLSIPNKDLYARFGKLRNGLQHFAPSPTENCGEQTLRFVFEVIDPFINDCWGLFAVDYDEDSEPYVNFVRALVSLEIPFLVSPEAAAAFKHWDVDWSQTTPSYKNLMQARVRQAVGTST